VALHAGVLAALLLSPSAKQPRPPERITVTLSDQVGLKSTSPEPAAKSAPDLAPTLGEAPPAPAEPKPVPAPPAPVHEAPPPPPAPKPVVKPVPQPPAPPKVAEKPAPTPAKAKPAAEPARKAEPAPSPPKHAGGQRIGADFLKGTGADEGTSKSAPAAAIGPEVMASLSSAITRQLRPNWTAPQGADADQLVTVLTWDLDEGGRLVSRPRVVSQSGITDANRAQASRHAEQAIRAVELSAPFQLPPQYYKTWRHVSAFRFDRKLSQ
jgi:outer membrane biosynthesis protein TonB